MRDPPQPASCSNEDWEGCIQRWRDNGDPPSWTPVKSEQTSKIQSDQDAPSSQASICGSKAAADEALTPPELPPVRPQLRDPPQPASRSNEDWGRGVQNWGANKDLPGWIPVKPEQTPNIQSDQAASSSQAPTGGSPSTANSTINMCTHCEMLPGTDWPLGLFCNKCYAELSVGLSGN